MAFRREEQYFFRYKYNEVCMKSYLEKLYKRWEAMKPEHGEQKRLYGIFLKKQALQIDAGFLDCQCRCSDKGTKKHLMQLRKIVNRHLERLNAPKQGNSLIRNLVKCFNPG